MKHIAIIPRINASVLGCLLSGLFAATTPLAVQGGFVPLTLPGLNQNILTWTDGAAYSSLYPDSDVSLGGVPFQFRSDASGNNIFYGPNLSSATDDSLTIPVNLYNVSQVYALINTAYGAPDEFVGSMTIKTSGNNFTFDLIEGVNVRDHFYGAFVNDTTDPNTTEAVFGDPNPGHAHYDMLRFDLPMPAGSEELKEIVFFSTSEGEAPGSHGKAFLAAATVFSQNVPDAGATWILLTSALALLGAANRRCAR